jgi:hypothetical protein
VFGGSTRPEAEFRERPLSGAWANTAEVDGPNVAHPSSILES